MPERKRYYVPSTREELELWMFNGNYASKSDMRRMKKEQLYAVYFDIREKMEDRFREEEEKLKDSVKYELKKQEEVQYELYPGLERTSRYQAKYS